MDKVKIVLNDKVVIEVELQSLVDETIHICWKTVQNNYVKGDKNG